MSIYQQRIDLKRKIQAHKAALDEMNAELTKLDAEVIKKLEEDGFESIRSDGATLYPITELSLKIKNAAAFAAAVTENGYANMASVNNRAANSWIKEAYLHREDIDGWVCDPDLLPDWLREHVEISEYTRLGMKTGG